MAIFLYIWPLLMIIVEGEYRGMNNAYKSIHLPAEIRTGQVSNILELEWCLVASMSLTLSSFRLILPIKLFIISVSKFNLYTLFDIFMKRGFLNMKTKNILTFVSGPKIELKITIAFHFVNTFQLPTLVSSDFNPPFLHHTCVKTYFIYRISYPYEKGFHNLL